MAKCCFSYAATRDQCFRFSFSMSGLKSVTVDLGDGTVMHCWVPKRLKTTKPNLVLIHGVGANAMWQFNDFISPLIAHFNVFVPDLIFFGDSFTTRPDRSETFQVVFCSLITSTCPRSDPKNTIFVVLTWNRPYLYSGTVCCRASDIIRSEED